MKPVKPMSPVKPVNPVSPVNPVKPASSSEPHSWGTVLKESALLRRVTTVKAKLQSEAKS